MKVVINNCYGGFGLSPLAVKKYLKLQGKECFTYVRTKYEDEDGVDEYTRIDENNKNIDDFVLSTKDLGFKTEEVPYEYWFSYYRIERNDPLLIQVVEELESKANDEYAELKVIEIPDNVDFEIDDYDGIETIHEVHRSWS